MQDLHLVQRSLLILAGFFFSQVTALLGQAFMTEPAHLALLFLHFKADQGRADQGTAMLVLDMFFVFLPEMADGGKHRVGGRLPQPAMGHPNDVAPRSSRNSTSPSCPFPPTISSSLRSMTDRPIRQGTHLPQDSSTQKCGEEAGRVHHAGGFVADDDPARAHDRSRSLQGFIIHGGVQKVFRDKPAGRPPELGGLELLSPLIPSPMSKMIERRVMPMGTSTKPMLFTDPAREKTLVPLLFSVPRLLNHLAPLMRSGAHWQRSPRYSKPWAFPTGRLRPTAGVWPGAFPSSPPGRYIRAVDSPHTKAPAPG